MTKKILVTGANGLIGRELLPYLVSKGHQVVAIDNCSRFPNYTNSSVIKISVEEYLKKSDIAFDYIYHLAAINGTSNFYQRPLEVIENNTLCDLSVFKYARIHHCKIIYASSSEIVTDTENIPTKEETDITIKDIHNPRWSYRLSKLISENYLSNSDLNYSIIRFFNLFSEHSGKGHFVFDIIEKIKNKNFELEGANETRSFCYVRDVVPAIVQVGEKVNRDIINIGGDDEIKIKDAADLICKRLNVVPDWKYRNSGNGSAKRRCPDLSKLKNILPEYSPRKFEEIIECMEI